MVAYNFKSAFINGIVFGEKRQTIRRDRKRHARPGEPVQLYTGMRTKHCRKLIHPDPVCVGCDDITLRLGHQAGEPVQDILINRIPLSAEEFDTFAVADGFRADGQFGPSQVMAMWWRRIHHTELFVGVLLRWEPAVINPRKVA